MNLPLEGLLRLKGRLRRRAAPRPQRYLDAAASVQPKARVKAELAPSLRGYQKDVEQAKFGRYTSSGHLGSADHAAIARACNGDGATIEAVGDLDADARARARTS